MLRPLVPNAFLCPIVRDLEFVPVERRVAESSGIWHFRKRELPVDRRRYLRELEPAAKPHNYVPLTMHALARDRRMT